MLKNIPLNGETEFHFMLGYRKRRTICSINN